MLVGFVVSVAWRYARVKGHFWLPLAGAWAAAATLHALIDSAVGERSQANSSLAAVAVLGAVVIVILIYPWSSAGRRRNCHRPTRWSRIRRRGDRGFLPRVRGRQA